MELWQDYQTGNFFSIDPKSGKQSPTNRFGAEKTKFTAYSTGFSRLVHNPDTKVNKTEKVYSVQPEKFDGYCQYPRPLERSSSNRTPIVRSSILPAKIMIKDKNKIPTPLKFLGLSQNRVPSPEKSFETFQSLPAKQFKTIDDVKKLEMKRPLKEMTTVSELSVKMEREKVNSSGYVRPKTKVERRKMKGFFLMGFKTCGELVQEERRMIQMTKPDFVERIKRLRERDQKSLIRMVSSGRRQEKQKGFE